ncbi:hypothetical protein ZWY2020_033470 [Hordeum vulgare]|nr:hypothetical protein ZWY2020_033470 [Hordeum vulgare]
MEEKPSLSSALFAGTRFDRSAWGHHMFRMGGPFCPSQAWRQAGEEAEAQEQEQGQRRRSRGRRSGDGPPPRPNSLFRNLHGDSTYPIDCPDNPKYLHVVGQIYKPFMIYVQDQTGQVLVLVKNKVAEILFSNINADDVSECYKSRHCMMVDTCDSGQSSTCGMLDGSGKTTIAKRKRTKKLDFHLIWLIVMKCLLNQGKNSPFCFQI